MGETDRIRLLQSFLISRLTYHLPFTPLTQTQHKQLNGLIRKAYCHSGWFFASNVDHVKLVAHV